MNKYGKTGSLPRPLCCILHYSMCPRVGNLSDCFTTQRYIPFLCFASCPQNDSISRAWHHLHACFPEDTLGCCQEFVMASNSSQKNRDVRRGRRVTNSSILLVLCFKNHKMLHVAPKMCRKRRPFLDTRILSECFTFAVAMLGSLVEWYKGGEFKGFCGSRCKGRCIRWNSFVSAGPGAAPKSGSTSGP